MPGTAQGTMGPPQKAHPVHSWSGVQSQPGSVGCCQQRVARKPARALAAEVDYTLAAPVISGVQ